MSNYGAKIAIKLSTISRKPSFIYNNRKNLKHDQEKVTPTKLIIYFHQQSNQTPILNYYYYYFE
jgi:hypothetical protein